MNSGTNGGLLTSVGAGFQKVGDSVVLHPIFRIASNTGNYSASGTLSTGIQ